MSEPRDHPLEFRWITQRCYCTTCMKQPPEDRATSRYTKSSRPLTFREQAALTNIILSRTQ